MEKERKAPRERPCIKKRERKKKKYSESIQANSQKGMGFFNRWKCNRNQGYKVW
jgi:hypothetical protein